MQNLLLIEKALKENYLPVFDNQIGIEPSALLSKIKQPMLVSDKIVATAPVGLSGGFGFSAEGEATPKSGNVPFTRFETRSRDMYVNVVISEKAVSLTGSGGAMVSALDAEIKGAYDTAKWNMGRALFGNGTGVLCKIRGASSYSNGIVTITVNDTRCLKEGLTVDLYAKGGDVPVSGGAGLRIVSVSKTGVSFTPSGGSAETVYTVTLSGASANPSISAVTVSGGAESGGGFITVQNSYNREITGLGAVFDNSITSIYGMKKADNLFLKPVEYDASSDISDSCITKALRIAKNDKNSNIDMLLCGDSAFDAYADYLRLNNYRVEDKTTTLKGGFKAIRFVFGNSEVDIVNEGFVPDKEMWGVDTSSIEFPQKKWRFAELQGGGIFNLMENSSCYRALLVNYGELICSNPGGCVRIYNCC